MNKNNFYFNKCVVNKNYKNAISTDSIDQALQKIWNEHKIIPTVSYQYLKSKHNG